MAKSILISGRIAASPMGYGGNSWAFLQYILGFRRLGFDVYYVEHLSPTECFDDAWRPASFLDCANTRYFRALIERFELTDRAGLLEWEGSNYVGLSHAEIAKIAPNIDLLINLSGGLHVKSLLAAPRRRMYVDLDPGYTQIWQEEYGLDMNLRGHEVHVTVGLNLGKPDCPFPTCGIDWQTTLPPVVAAEWTTDQSPGPAYSTVADWRGFGSVEWHGIHYGQKADEFLRLIELPRRVSAPFELCLFIHPDEPGRFALEEHGWQLSSPSDQVANPDSYRDYIFRSRGELTAVKQGYAAGRTGWFSDRSGCYLTAGRPVIVQDTGIGRYLPTGSGLLTFDSLETAVVAVEQVESEYPRHATAAAAFAREFLDSDIVLARLLRLAGI
jgi:hypothetical protein